MPEYFWYLTHFITGEWLCSEVPCSSGKSCCNFAPGFYPSLPEKGISNMFHPSGSLAIDCHCCKQFLWWQGKHYLFLEVTSQLHRQLVPLQVSIHHLTNQQNSTWITTLTVNSQPWLMYLLAASDEQGPASIPNKVWGLQQYFFFSSLMKIGIVQCPEG